MPVFHRSQRLQIYGNRAEVTQLHNNRYEIVVRCTAKNDTQAWYNDNKGQIFAAFGTLYSAQMSIEGIDARTGEAYPNMVLVRNEAGFLGSDYVITFVYQTLTSSYVQEVPEKVDLELNGLRRVTRTLIAVADTSYNKAVGGVTIEHTALGYITKTLTLAAVQEDVLEANEGGFTRIQETYLEPGTLSESKSNLKDGIIQVTTEFLITEGSVAGAKIARTENNTNGIKTITVTDLRKKDGTSVIDSSESEAGVSSTPISSYNSLDPFRYPGVVNLVKRTIDARSYTESDDILSFEFHLTPPAESLIDTETFVFIQSASQVNATDKVYPGGGSASTGLWNPTDWATIYASGLDHNKNPFSKTDALRGYRAFANLDVTVTEPASNLEGNFLINGRPILNGNSANIGMKGGPANPEESKFVLDITIVPAFETIPEGGSAGTVYYKKRITTATIPARTVPDGSGGTTAISYLPENTTQVGSDFSTASRRFSASSGVGSVLQASGAALADATSVPVVQLDLQKAPANASDLKHSTIAVIKGGQTGGKEQGRIVTDYVPSTGKITLSSGVSLFDDYTTSSTNTYTLFGITREGFVSQRISSTELLLDHSTTQIPRSTKFDDCLNGVTLHITAGTGSGESLAITDYDGLSGKVTVATGFSATLDATSKYRIGPA
tara:strand:+ start:623 stop:2623 length:2001 start_codon:yes stop_codon:yes gene_type:complete